MAVFGIAAIALVDSLPVRLVVAVALLGLIPANYMVSETIKRQAARDQS